jgi:kinetochore protein Nuf2
MSGFLGADYGGGGGNTIHNHTQFIFPILKSGEILQCMKELGIEIQKVELTEPQRHKEKLRKVFWQLLDICCGLTEDDLQKLAPKVHDTVRFPQIHDNFLDLLFFQKLKECLKTCGFHDFSWKDLHVPTAKRFRVQLSAIINMAKFREEQLKVYAELNEPRAQLLLTLEEIHKEQEHLQASLDQALSTNNGHMDELDILVGECQDLESEIARSNKLQASKREKAALLKREANDLKDELSSATWALQEGQAEEEQLQSQIVASPERKKASLQQKKERLEMEKQEARQLQDSCQETKTKTHIVENTIKEIRTCLELQKQVTAEAEKYDHAMGLLHSTKKEVDQNQESALDLQEKQEEAERLLVRVEEKLVANRKTAKLKMNAAQDRLGTSNSNLKEVEQERRQGMERVKAGADEIIHIKQQMEMAQQQVEREIADLLQEYKATEEKFLEQNERRMQVLETLSC